MTSQSLVVNLTSQSEKHCKYCSKDFKTVTSRKKHENETHFVKIQICEICQKECLSNLALRNHKRKHKYQNCSKCLKSFNLINFTRHFKSCKNEPKKKSDKKVECPKCFKEFSWTQSMKRHLNLCMTPKEVKEFKCPLCPKSYAWKQSLTKHIYDSH